MAKRKHKRYRKLDSADVQGEGSFVKIKNLNIAEIMEHVSPNGASETPDGAEAAAIGLQVLDSMVVDWDWVDDDDEPLPVPVDNPGTVASLPFQESTWLLQETGIDKALDQKN